MEERKKEGLANVNDLDTSKDDSIIDIDSVIENSDIVQIDDGTDSDYDEEYMTNVSNNLVSEVDALLSSESNDEADDAPLTKVEPEVPVNEEPKVESEVVEPVKEEAKVVEEKNPAESMFDDAPVANQTLEEVNNVVEQHNDAIEQRSFEEMRREQLNNSMEKKNQRFEHTEVPNSSNSKYVSYESRVIRWALLFIVFFIGGFFLMLKSFNFNKEEYISYAETTNLDYRVYLKENKFYEEKFLEKGMLYVASLIDHIDIDFLYNFNIDEKVDLDFKYNITGVLSITDNDGKNVYLTKDYKLLDDKTFKMNGEQDHTLKESIIIDYGAYNKLANSFKSTYGLDTASKLTVYLNVDKTSANQELKDMEKDSNMLIEIPLSQRSVSISMDYKDINRHSSLVKSSSVTVKSYAFIAIAVVLLGGAVFGLYKLLRLLGFMTNKKSNYDKFIAKMMRQYDRLIVVHYTCPDLSNYNVIKIKEFNELLDMRDNLKVPIMFYNVTDHQKSYFYILNNNDLYLLILKAVDFEKQ